MIQKIIIKEWDGHFVKKTIGYNPELSHLAEFFIDGGRMDWDLDWKDWVYNSPNYTCISGNEVGICIDDDNIEVMSDILDEDTIFIVSKEKFLKLIKAWYRILELKSEIIELTQDDKDRITFEYDTPEGHKKIVVE